MQSVSSRHCDESVRAVTHNESGQDVGDEQLAEISPGMGTSGAKKPFQAMSEHVQVDRVACCVFHATHGAPE